MARGAGGRLIVHLEGDLAGPIPPTLTVTGPGREESRLLDALALASHQITIADLEPGVYWIVLTGTGSSDAAGGTAIEVGIHDALTTLVRARIDSGRLSIDPFRPDPFGLADGLDARFLATLPGSGEEAGSGLLTSPEPARQTTSTVLI
jgi:hypothetical protein